MIHLHSTFQMHSPNSSLGFAIQLKAKENFRKAETFLLHFTEDI
jgi:hypothetical protein